MLNDLTPDPQTVEIYKGIDCCDEVQTELQSIIQDIASLRGQCDNLRNLMTQQHQGLADEMTQHRGAIEQKLQNIEQEIQTLQTRTNAILTRVSRLQGVFDQYLLEFRTWIDWFATALNQINGCTCPNNPLPPPPKIG